MNNVKKVKIKLINFFLKIPKEANERKGAMKETWVMAYTLPLLLLQNLHIRMVSRGKLLYYLFDSVFIKVFSLWLEYWCWDIPPILLFVYFQCWTHFISLSDWDSHMMTSVMTWVKRAVVSLCCLLCHLSPSLVSSGSSSVSVVNSKIKNMKGEKNVLL